MDEGEDEEADAVHKPERMYLQILKFYLVEKTRISYILLISVELKIKPSCES